MQVDWGRIGCCLVDSDHTCPNCKAGIETLSISGPLKVTIERVK